jgi:hypothetical protein
MEAKLIPVSGCMQVVLGVFTLGVAPLAMKLQERGWPKVVDEQGLETRGGLRIPWNEFTNIQKVITNVNGTVTERFELHSPQGKVPVVVYRMENGPQVLQYIWERLPESAKMVAG